MKRIIAAILLTLGVMAGFTSSAEASSAQAKYPGYTWVNHANTGNDQAFAIQCTGSYSGNVYWVQKGQSSTTKCPGVNGAVWGMYVPVNFNLTCNFGSFTWYPPPGTWVTPPNGSAQCWTTHRG